MLLCSGCDVKLMNEFICATVDTSHLYCFVLYQLCSLLSISHAQKLLAPTVYQLREIQQCRSHQYSWSGFNRTTFRGNSHNILEFGSTPGRPVDMATVDRVEIDGCKQFKVTLPNLRSTQVPQEPILITQKWRRKNFYPAALGAASPPTATRPLQISWLWPCIVIGIGCVCY